MIGIVISCLSLIAWETNARAGTPTDASQALPIGGMAIKQETLVYLIKSFAIEALKKSLKPIPDGSGSSDSDQFEISLPGYSNTIALPIASDTAVGQIFDVLNIKGPVGIKLDPAKIKLRLPDSAFSINVSPPTQKNPNTFKVTAGWRITNLSAHANQFAVNVPQGLFSEPFSLVASPLDFAVKKGHSIDFSVSFYATLGPDGAKIHLADFKSNIIESADPSLLDLKVGPISQVTAEKTVSGKDLNLSIENKGDGFGIQANEQDIQDYFMSFEPLLFENLKKTLVPLISDNIQKAAKEFQAQKPIHYPYNTNTFLTSIKLNDGDAQKLISDIQLDFSLSAVQSLGLGKEVFATQVSTGICLDGQCVESAVSPSSISDRDVPRVAQTKNGVGIVIYQSLLKDILHSPAVQKRIEDYFATVVAKVVQSAGKYEKYLEGAGKGIHLGKKAVFVAFDPATQEIVLVINFEIEPSQFGLAEYIFKDGTHLSLPVQLKARIGAIVQDGNGEYSFPLTFSPPIDPNGNISAITICNEADCPNSISNEKTDSKIGAVTSAINSVVGLVSPIALSEKTLKAVVQKLNLALRSRMLAFLPSGKFDIKIPNDLTYQGLKMVPKSVEITPDQQLLFVGQVSDEVTQNEK